MLIWLAFFTLLYTYYRDLAQLLSGLTSAAMPIHLHPIILNCSLASSNRHRISICSCFFPLDKPRFITTVPKECENQQYIIQHKFTMRQILSLKLPTVAKVLHSYYNILKIHPKVNLMNTKAIVSKIGQINMKTSCKKDQCGICGR